MIYRHFFWDFDGTLYDTYGRITRTCVFALRDVGACASYDAVYPVVKRSLDTCYRTFAAPKGIEKDVFVDAYHAHNETEGPESIRPYPGVRETLQAVIDGGGRNYLYTHRGASAARWLQYDGLEGLFADAVNSRDGFPAKPAPDALNHLIQKHSLDRAECVMVGDRDIDLDAGKNAGIACALFDPEGFYPDCDTPWRFADMASLRKALTN